PLLPFRRLALALALRCLGLLRFRRGDLRLRRPGAISAGAVLAARGYGRFALCCLRGDDDGVRQALGAAFVAEDLGGLGPAVALERVLLQLVLELFLRVLADFLPCTRRD